VVALNVRTNPTIPDQLPRLQSAMYFELTDHFIVAADLDQTWAFFGDAENLPRITPPTLGFRILTPLPIEMRSDVLLDYTIRWMGLPVRWRTRIIDWTPRTQFIDLQLRGPYALWHHQHRFAKHGSGVECFDRVIYKLPGGLVGAIAHQLLVGRQLIDIFQYRREAIGKLLGDVRPQQDEVLVRAL
jgi:ligand-binding SRPBCC domain-containing protein